jgi:hypothetical protein
MRKRGRRFDHVVSVMRIKPMSSCWKGSRENQSLDQPINLDLYLDYVQYYEIIFVCFFLALGAFL